MPLTIDPRIVISHVVIHCNYCQEKKRRVKGKRKEKGKEKGKERQRQRQRQREKDEGKRRVEKKKHKMVKCTRHSLIRDKCSSGCNEKRKRSKLSKRKR